MAGRAKRSGLGQPSFALLKRIAHVQKSTGHYPSISAVLRDGSPAAWAMVDALCRRVLISPVGDGRVRVTSYGWQYLRRRHD